MTGPLVRLGGCTNRLGSGEVKRIPAGSVWTTMDRLSLVDSLAPVSTTQNPEALILFRVSATKHDGKIWIPSTS